MITNLDRRYAFTHFLDDRAAFMAQHGGKKTFRVFAEHHPWVAGERVRPKSIARKLFEGYRGFDDYVNVVLEDVVEYEWTADGRRVTKLDQILMNGNYIAMLVPGGEGPGDV